MFNKELAQGSLNKTKESLVTKEVSEAAFENENGIETVRKYEVSNVFKEIIDRGFSNEFAVKNLVDGTDKTSEFMSLAAPLYESRDYESIKRIVIDNNYDIAAVEKESASINARSPIIRSTQTRYFYERRTAGGWTKEWNTIVRGSYSWNMNTGVYSSASSDVYPQELNFGGAWSAWKSNWYADVAYSSGNRVVTFRGGTVSMGIGVANLIVQIYSILELVIGISPYN